MHIQHMPQAPNLSSLRAQLTALRATLQQEEDRVHKPAARVVRRPLMMFVLLSMQCRALGGQGNPQRGQVRCWMRVLSVKLAVVLSAVRLTNPWSG